MELVCRDEDQIYSLAQPRIKIVQSKESPDGKYLLFRENPFYTFPVFLLSLMEYEVRCEIVQRSRGRVWG